LKQLCNDLGQFAIQVRQVGFSLNGGVGERVTGPRELVHGERKSFVGGYSWQRSGLGVGTPGLYVGGGGT
jgi:hypothetical protein